MTAQPEQPVSYSPEFIASVERLNLFYHIHHQNKSLLKNVGVFLDELRNMEFMPVELLMEWLHTAGDVSQTVDALMHICQKEFVGVANEWLNTASDEEQIAVRETLKTPILDKMDRILNETTEERTQRLLLEMLNIHD